jgi:hypothetical protein
MAAYEAALSRVLAGQALSDNVVMISKTGADSGSASKTGTDGAATPPAP